MNASAPAEILLAAKGVRCEFPRPSGEPQIVLEDIHFTLATGEIVGLLGRSGCGKSTLLRIVTGLMRPTRGEILYRGKKIAGPTLGIAMVFQTFAIFPWLTVLENVKAGLVAERVPEREAARRAEEAIALIGLDGFENAYPRELSGGMRQRVGFARALVVGPEILVMDEPFSALDVLTGETLRSDLLDLWSEHRLGLHAILLVTHNIEEAVSLCDRILVMSSHPGRISTEIAVPLSHPRDRLSPEFRAIVEDIYARMMAGPAPQRSGKSTVGTVTLTSWLPVISATRIVGLTDTLNLVPFAGEAELSALAARLSLNVAGLFRVAEVARMLGFVEFHDATLRLTAAGRALADAGIRERNGVFAEHLLRAVPLAAFIHRVLEERPNHEAPRSRFLEELEDHLSPSEAEHTLTAVTNWGRYADIFSYDHRTRLFRLSSP